MIGFLKALVKNVISWHYPLILFLRSLFNKLAFFKILGRVGGYEEKKQTAQQYFSERYLPGFTPPPPF